MDLLSKIASGSNEMRAMLGVCKSWNAGFKSSVTSFRATMPQFRALGLHDIQGFEGLKNVTLCGSLVVIGLWSLQGSSVESLDLSGCSGVSFEFLSTLNGAPLTCLSLNNCSMGERCRMDCVRHERIDDHCALALSRMRLPLTALYLNGADIGDEGLEALLEFRALRIFSFMEFSASKVSEVGFSALAQLSLSVLQMSRRRFRDDLNGGVEQDFSFDCLSVFGGCGMQLTYLWLDLKEAVFSVEGLSGLEGMPLTSLDLTNCKSLTNSCILSLRGLPLQHLRLEFLGPLSFLTPEGWEGLRGLPLSSFYLSIPPRLQFHETPTASDPILNCLRESPLTDLSFSYPTSTFSTVSSRITDEGMASLRGLPLTSLKLDSCSWVTDQGFAVLAGMPLKKLEMTDCAFLTAAGLQVLGGLQLDVLDIRGVPLITDLDLSYLMAALSSFSGWVGLRH